MKIARNTLKKEELCKIGKIPDGKYVSYFAFPGGVIVGKAKDRGDAKKFPEKNPHKGTGYTE